MFTKRTDLAIEAHELWRESAGKTTRLAGVKATEKKIQGYPVTQVDILDREGEAALGKPAGSYRTLDLTVFWQRGDGFFDRAVRAVGQQVKELTPDSGPVLVVGLGNRAMTPDAVGPLAADSVLIGEVRNARNKATKSDLKTAIKKFEAAAAEGNRTEADGAYKVAVKKVDQAVAKGVLHKNTAAHRKSAMTLKLNKIG